MNTSPSSVYELARKLGNDVAEGKLDHVLREIHNLVERIITEPIYAAQVLSSAELDRLCLEVGHKNFSLLSAANKSIDLGVKDEPTIVYIVSRLQKSGGHSRLVRDFINNSTHKKHLIISTEIGGPSDKNYFQNLFDVDENVQILYAPRWSSFHEKLTWLQSILINNQPEHIHLFNHHQDSVSVAAVVPELGLRASFYHHGDHHMCLGVHLSHLSHIDFHPMGYHYCRENLGINNTYLPLTFQDRKGDKVQSNFMNGGCLTTATAARSNKVEIPYYCNYIDFIPEILNLTKGHHIHLGKLTPWALFRIRNKMRKLDIPRDRFIYMEWTPSVWGAIQDYGVDVYISSFPYGGGLTLIEAMGAATPVIMHQHMFSRVISGLELAYPEAFSWSDPASLLKHLAMLTPEQISHEKILARKHYEKFHDSGILKKYLENPKLIQIDVPGLNNNFSPRYDEWALWVEERLNLWHLMYRFIYRKFRRLRLFFS